MNNEFCDFSILRDLRKQRNMSIAELAAAAEVTPSVISKLERNCTRAELETLFRLARVFGLTLSDLLALAENRTCQRTDEEAYESGEFHFRRVRYANLRCMEAVAAAGAVLATPRSHGDDYELCWVRSGRVQIALPSEKYILEPGMALQFDALLHHEYKVLEDCRMVIVHLRKERRF